MSDTTSTTTPIKAKTAAKAKTTAKPKNTQAEDFGQSHPKEWIEYTVGLAVYELYGIFWQPKVGQQSKAIKGGELQYIDYSVPCFELAQILSKPPHVITQEIKELLSGDSFERVNNKYDKYIKIDAVSGYLNFELSKDYLKQVALSMGQWFAEPKGFLSSHRRVRFIVAGPAVGGQLEHALAEKTYRLAQQLYGLLGYETSSIYLVSDQSDYAAESLARLLASEIYSHEDLTLEAFHELSVQNLQVAQLRRRVKQALANPGSLDTEASIHATLHAARENSMAKWRDIFDKIGVSFDRTLFESDIAGNVHKMLDSGTTSLDIDIVVDEATGAAYYISEDQMVPLRSANGLLYTAAYHLYVLQTTVESAAENEHTTEHIVIIAPKKLHDMLAKAAPASRITFISPIEDHVSIEELLENGVSIRNIFDKVQESLLSDEASYHEDHDQRRKTIAMIDLPLELHTHALQTKPHTALEFLKEMVSGLNLLEPAAPVYISVKND